MAGLFQRRGARATGVVLALFMLTILVTVSPMGSVASDFMDRFRVKKFAAITVDMESFRGFQTDMLFRLATSDTDELQSAAQDLATFETSYGDLDMMGGPEGFGSPDADQVKPNPMEHVEEFESAEEAREAFGEFRQPEDLPDGLDDNPRIYVGEAGWVTVTVDTEKAQSIVDELNLPIYSLPDPEAYPEMTFTMDIPESLVLHYENADEQLMVGQMTSPTLRTPEGVNMDELREDMLQLPGLPTDFVTELRSIEDWEETLVIPVPEGWSSEDVTVQGQPGLLLTADDEDQGVVLWEDDGMLYVVGGTQTGDTLQDVADSLS